jgi:N-acetylmuramoyl-L-alanine amidase
MKLLAVLAASVSVLVAQSAPGPMRTVTAVRYWTVGEVTRIAVEVTGDFEVRSDHLHNPERVYYDIVRARPMIESRRVYSRTLDDKLVKSVRVAERQPGVTRVVLDLVQNVEASASKLSNPSRLMVELRAASPAPSDPSAAGAGAQPPATASAPAPAPPPAIVRQEPPRVGSRPEKKTADPPVTVPENVTAEPSKAQMAKAKTPENALPSAEAVARRAPVPAATTPAAPPPATPDEIGKAARPTSTGQNSLVRTLGLKLERVVIDPGHGGHDQGTQGPHGLLEKDLVLDVALRLGKLVESRMGAEVVYTRSDDTFVPLEGRTALANEKKADLFLSVHANSSSLPRTAGVETYYLNIKGSSSDALDVAARENASSQKSIFELTDVIQRLAKYDKAEESREFAGRIQSALYAFSARNVAGAKNRGVRTAPFVVLIGANMPSVLAEIGFLSNPREEALLKKSDYRQKVAESLYRGVSRYGDSLSHFQVARAQN